MRRYMVALAAGLMLLAAGCDDDSGADSGLPEGIPTFTGSESVPGSTLTEGDTFLGTWRTSEQVPAVQAYFERELADGDWRIVEEREIDGGVIIRIENPDEPDTAGTIIVRRDDDTTRIVKTIERNTDEDPDTDEDGDATPDQDGDPDEGSDDEGDAGASSSGLPAGYPADVPLPDGAQIVSGTAPLVGTVQYYLVEFNSNGSPADVISFFNDALPDEGWDTGAANDDPEAFILNFSRGDDRVTVTGGVEGDGTEASVTIVIQD